MSISSFICLMWSFHFPICLPLQVPTRVFDMYVQREQFTRVLVPFWLLFCSKGAKAVLRSLSQTLLIRKKLDQNFAPPSDDKQMVINCNAKPILFLAKKEKKTLSNAILCTGLSILKFKIICSFGGKSETAC